MTTKFGSAERSGPARWWARQQEKASPLSGTWAGPADAFERMAVSVQVVAL